MPPLAGRMTSYIAALWASARQPSMHNRITGVTAPEPGQSPSVRSAPESAAHPQIQAERLLRQIIPEDLHLSLGAVGYCDVAGKTHPNYRLFKNRKTEVTDKQGCVYSSCIHLTDTAAPDTDRIIAEYLLITNDETEYLKTANLTRIVSGVGPRDEMTEYQRATLAQHEAAYRGYQQAYYEAGLRQQQAIAHQYGLNNLAQLQNTQNAQTMAALQNQNQSFLLAVTTFGMAPFLTNIYGNRYNW